MTEAKVQKLALRYLEKHYNRQATKPLWARAEVRTRKQYGGKRADGLLVLRHWLWGRYVVSMEAKSHKTIPAIRPRLDPYKLMWNSLKAGLVGCLATGAYLALFKMSDGLFQFLLPLNIFICSGLIYGIITYRSYRHKVVNVVEQLMHYPANEQWLAFSMDSFSALPEKEQTVLKKICRFEGVGLLVVKPSGRVKVAVSPRSRIKWFGNFTQYYSLSKSVLREV